MIRRLSFVILALVVVAGYLFAQKNSSFNGFELADKTEKILRKPADYRDHYEILGSWTVLDPKTEMRPPFPVKRHITEETIPMKQAWRGHSAFRIEVGEAKILIDPFLSDNPSRDNGWSGALQARTRHREVTDEGDCGDG